MGAIEAIERIRAAGFELSLNENGDLFIEPESQLNQAQRKFMQTRKTEIMLHLAMEKLSDKEAWRRSRWAATLGEASKAARYLNLVDIDSFDDRRNPEAHLYQPQKIVTGETEVVFYFELDAPEMPELPTLYVKNPDVNQRYAIEIWCEKSTMNDILEPLCKKYEANLVTGLGELSITRVNELAHRIEETKKPTWILYISDFDPAGMSMPVAVARKIEFLTQHQDCDVKLFSIILTLAQTQKYQLPRTPIKESELRAKGFEARFGTGATELDALEALHPGEFKKIVEAAIVNYWDGTLYRQIHDALVEAEAEAEEIQDACYAKHADEIEESKKEWLAIQTDYVKWTAKNEELYQAIADELQDKIPDDLEHPEPEVADELPNALFDSERNYIDQHQCYKAFQGK